MDLLTKRKDYMSQELCGRCEEPIEQSQASVIPSIGFPRYHVGCWEREREEIREDHIRGDIDRVLDTEEMEGLFA